MPSPESRVDLAQAADALASEVDRLLDHGRVDGDWTDLEGALDSLRSALRASTHPEQSGRVRAEDVALARRAVENLLGDDDLASQARGKAVDRILAALDPASPTPTEARGDLEWAFRLMRDCLQTGKKPEDYEQDRLDEIADALTRPTPTEQEDDR